MNKKLVTVIILMILLVLISVAVNAAPSGAERDASFIKRIFDDIHLIIDGLYGLVQPLIGLGVAVMLGLQAKSLRNQKQSKATLNAQNNALDDIRTAVKPPPQE